MRRADGRLFNSVTKHSEDLIHKPPKRLSGFLNVYPRSVAPSYATREDADEYAADTRLACIDLSDFEEGHGLSQKVTP